MKPRCQALRGPNRITCDGHTPGDPFLVVGKTGFWLVKICLFCALERPRKWTIPAAQKLVKLDQPGVGVYAWFCDFDLGAELRGEVIVTSSFDEALSGVSF